MKLAQKEVVEQSCFSITFSLLAVHKRNKLLCNAFQPIIEISQQRVHQKDAKELLKEDHNGEQLNHQVKSTRLGGEEGDGEQSIGGTVDGEQWHEGAGDVLVCLAHQNDHSRVLLPKVGSCTTVLYFR